MVNNNLCTGCYACYNSCPVNAIEMVPNNMGFCYPKINEEICIHCNKCVSVCPVINKPSSSVELEEQRAYVAVSKDKDVQFMSSSGGAFTEICRSLKSDKLVIFGAMLTKDGVKHTYVEGLDQISILQKSKYIQSNIGNMYTKAKEFLEQGRKVVFSGTPCQIAGLRSYLKKEYENLLCIDLICYGVGSIVAFCECMKYAEKEYGSKIVKYTFRAKRRFRGGVNERHTSEYLLQNGKKEFVEKDRYSQLFLHQLCSRECCGERCKYRTRERLGDITISDFKNHREIMKPSQYIQKYYSTIIFNNTTGLSVISALSEHMDMIPITINDVLQDNPLFARSGESNKDKVFFEKDWKEMGPEKAIEKWTHKPILSLRDKVIRLLPVQIFVLYYKLQKR